MLPASIPFSKDPIDCFSTRPFKMNNTRSVFAHQPVFKPTTAMVRMFAMKHFEWLPMSKSDGQNFVQQLQIIPGQS